MERLGLVSQLEGDLERIISLGMLSRDGLLPSEQTLAEKYRVSRATAREALVRLSVRGLVVQHPGRRARAVAVEEAMTLENLAMALHGEESTHPERRRLLEGYLSLKREVTVELLVAACGHASKEEMDRLEQACFALADVVRWRHQRHEWMEREFELLREAAVAAGRPGHFLLIQSLARASRGVAERVLPHVEAQAVNRWAEFAFFALTERNVQALRTELPPLMRASDEHVLRGLAKAREPGGTLESHRIPEAHRAASGAPEVGSSTPESAKSGPEVCGSAPAEAGLQADEPSPEVGPSVPAPAGEGLCTDKASSEVKQSAPVSAEAGLFADDASSEGDRSEPVPGEAGPGANGTSSVARPSAPASAEEELEARDLSSKVGQSAPAPMEAQGLGPLCASRSGCQTRSGKTQPEGMAEPASGTPFHPPGSVALEAGVAPDELEAPGGQVRSAPCGQALCRTSGTCPRLEGAPPPAS